MKRFRDWTILPKVMTISVVSVILITTCIMLYLLPTFEKRILDEKQVYTKAVVDLAWQTMQLYGERAAAGEMTIDQAKRDAIVQIKNLRYKGEEYFWINDLEPRMVMHPTKPELDGQPLGDFKDPKGKRLFIEMVETVKASDAGFVNYLWPKPGESEPVPKISYVKLYKPWGWVIGSGIYIDDVKKDISVFKVSLSLFTVTIALIMLLLAYTIASGISTPIRDAVDRLDKIASGTVNRNDRLVVEQNDEAGRLATAYNSMTQTLATVLLRLRTSDHELREVSDNIEEASHRVVAGAQRQFAAVEDGVTGITEINANIKQITTNVEELVQSAVDTSSSINEMTASIEESLKHVSILNDSVSQVGAAITQINTSIKRVGEYITHLSQAAETTASSVTEMDATTRSVEEAATESSNLAAQVLADAELGRSTVDAARSSMRDVTTSTRTTVESVQKLAHAVKNIGSVLTVIDDVTEQTRLLALNAAIIATQAGENGKGFTVVADAIKELAQKARSSTREIEQIIAGIQDEARRAQESVLQTERRVVESENQSRQSMQALEKILDSARISSQRSEGIARAMDEQARGSQIIRTAMHNITDRVIDIVKANKEQASSSELILQAAERMRDLSERVHTTAGEQDISGKQISKATERVNEMISSIRRACADQERQTSQVHDAIAGIRDLTKENIDVVKVLDESLKNMAVQIVTIGEEIGRFTIDGEAVPEQAAAPVEKPVSDGDGA